MRPSAAALMHGPSPSEYWILSTLVTKSAVATMVSARFSSSSVRPGSVGARDGPDREARPPGSGCPPARADPVASLDSETRLWVRSSSGSVDCRAARHPRIRSSAHRRPAHRGCARHCCCLPQYTCPDARSGRIRMTTRSSRTIA